MSHTLELMRVHADCEGQNGDRKRLDKHAPGRAARRTPIPFARCIGFVCVYSCLLACLRRA